MRLLKVLAAAALLSLGAGAPASAQSFSEPAAFQAQHPDRDVLNGGAPTPASRTAAGPLAAYNAQAAAGGEIYLVHRHPRAIRRRHH